MKTIFKILVALLLVLFGITIAKPNENSLSFKLQDQLSDFEQQITDPSSNYETNGNVKIEPNLANNIGSKVDDFIDKASDYAISFIKNVLG